MTGLAPYAVDLDQLASTIAALDRYGARCDELLAEVDRRVDRLHETWSGRTAESQRDAHERWAAGFAQLRDGLATMRRAAATAEGNYTAAVDANVRMWSL